MNATPVLLVHYGEDWIRGSERCLLDSAGPPRSQPVYAVALVQ